MTGFTDEDVTGEKIMRKKIIAMMAAAITGMFCICQMSSGQEAEAVTENAADQAYEEASYEGEPLQDITVAGWHIVTEYVQINKSLENISVAMGYSGVQTSEFVKTAKEGNVFCMVKLLIEKEGSREEIDWEKMTLTDGDGISYQRTEDEFISDLGMKRMPGTKLNFGSNEGWIAFEIPEQAADQLTISYPFEEEVYSCRLLNDEPKQDEQNSFFGQQNMTDEALLAELQAGYSFEEASIILDPYQCSPLTGMIVFVTEEETDVTINVKGKSAENDIVGHFMPAKEHLLPVYGLYNGGKTQIEVTLGDGRSRIFEVETEELPIPVGEISVEMSDPEAYDWNEVTIVCSLGGTLYAVDGAGDIRWYYTGGGTMGVHPLRNGHLMVPTSFIVKPSYYRSGLQEIDLSGRVYCDYEIPGGQHHDFQELENGNLLVAGDQPDLSVVEDYVVEIDRDTGEVVWELDMKDILPVEDGMSASMNTDGTEESDWFHNNSLWYDAANDLVLLSGRHKDAIVAVHKEEKTLAWILGDPDGWEDVASSYFFTPVGEDFEWFYAQHQITMLDNGDIMLFDNGTAKVKRYNDAERVTGEDVYSRAVIYHIDTEDMTVSQVFQYGKERGAEWYSDWISGVETLDGTKDVLWITAGSHLYDPASGNHGLGPADLFVPDLVKSTHMDLVADGNLACEITVEGDAFASLSYRSLRCPMYSVSTYPNISTPAILRGNLGESAQADPEEITVSAEDLKQAQALPSDDWQFTRDEIKITLTGTYDTQAAADEITSSYMILNSGVETRIYPLTSNAVEREGNTGVSVSGWVSAVGLDDSYDVYLLLDGEIYDTGYRL